MAKGYKVLYRRNKKLESCVAEMGDGGVRYIRGKMVFPPKGWGPLAVFKTKEDALKLFYNRILFPIYECEYKKSRKKYLHDPSYDYKPVNIELPKGTGFADWVIIGKEVKV